MTVDLILTFNDLVAEDVVISTLRNAIIKNGKLGELRINVSSIVAIPPFNTSTAATPTSKTTPKPDGTFINLQDILLVYLFVAFYDGKVIPGELVVSGDSLSMLPTRR